MVGLNALVMVRLLLRRVVAVLVSVVVVVDVCVTDVAVVVVVVAVVVEVVIFGVHLPQPSQRSPRVLSCTPLPSYARQRATHSWTSLATSERL